MSLLGTRVNDELGAATQERIVALVGEYPDRETALAWKQLLQARWPRPKAAMPKQRLSGSNPHREAAVRAAAKLGERSLEAIRGIQYLAELRGAEFIELVLARTRSVERAGGLLVLDGSRRRTAGGVFLYLAKGSLTDAERRRWHQLVRTRR